MISLKVKFKNLSTNERGGTLSIQILHDRQVRQIKTNYRIYPNEWDDKDSSIQIDKASEERVEYLRNIESAIIIIIDQINSSIRYLEDKGSPYTTNDILQAYNSHKTRYLCPFMENIILSMGCIGRMRTSETYSCTLNSFMRFRKGVDVYINEIDSELLLSYEAWLKGQGVCLNTISFYMRILRAVYNRAVEKGIIQQRYPFKHVYTGIEKTQKRAVNIKMIRQIKLANLSLFPHLDYARDMFMLSFYTRGMSFVDMAYLRKENLNDGILSYRRKKTGQLLYIRWERCMQDIIDKYPKISNSPYLLPIIKKAEDDARKQYLNAILCINKNLKDLSKMLGFSTKLTTYVARHSWASIAKSKNIPLSVICEGMGHDSEMTTQIYLASLDNAVIDKANSLILKGL